MSVDLWWGVDDFRLEIKESVSIGRESHARWYSLVRLCALSEEVTIRHMDCSARNESGLQSTDNFVKMAQWSDAVQWVEERDEARYESWEVDHMALYKCVYYYYIIIKSAMSAWHIEWCMQANNTRWAIISGPFGFYRHNCGNRCYF